MAKKSETPKKKPRGRWRAAVAAAVVAGGRR